MEKLNFAIVPRAVGDDLLIAEMEVEYACPVNVFESASMYYWFFRWGVFITVDEGLTSEVLREENFRKIFVRNAQGKIVAGINIALKHGPIKDKYSKEGETWFPVRAESESTWILRPGGICIVLGPKLALKEPPCESPYDDRMFYFLPKRA